ncbi:helix-turn-helix transcriptional regulator [Natrononativus amylolyticus]|uniref:helix-turn-helix transcriptional regulator n=1 Tax=Natrononativus amylolyticus TaxID=2963434 RepID=UPI0020CCBA3E|nr:hypothetical protein [Natrononativus amylolyticus]
MNRAAPVGLVVLVIVVALAGVSGSIVADTGAQVDSQDRAPATDTVQQTTDAQENFSGSSSQEFDSTTFEITVYENGTATWTFRHDRLLSSSSEEAEFEEFAEEFEEEETDLYVRFTEQAQALTGTGSDETDREMEATNFDRSAGIERQLNSIGVVEMTFTWTEFAEVDNGTVTVGDVFDGGFYIGSGQTLVVQPGDDLVFASVQPEAEYTGPSVEESDSVSWSGDYEFLDGHPHIVFEQPTEEGDGADDSDEESQTTEPEEESSSWLVVAGLLVAALGLGGAFVWHRFGRSSTNGGPPDAGTAGATEGAAGGDPAAAGAAAIGSEPDTVPDEDLLTDEDRVVTLIRNNGGRMKQVNIVDETGWSKSKVSMLLSDMEEDGTISKLRVGRENIISLEGFEPEATKSPFEE